MRLSDFRDRERISLCAKEISRLTQGLGPITIMHVCGSHEHTLVRWALRELLPPNLRMVAGPGCPVCVCSVADIALAMEAADKGAILLTYGDMLRDPTPQGSLAEARAKGADIRVVYSPQDAVRVARENPGREVVLFSVGFETTAAPLAAVITSSLPPNLSFILSHKLTPPAVEALLAGGVGFEAMIAPGHVSSIVGAEAWSVFPAKYQIPTVVAGFEPLDIMLAVLEIVKMLRDGKPRLVNEYRRVVKPEGNPRAKALMAEAFRVGAARWRGLGDIPNSGLFLADRYEHLDAAKKLGLRGREGADEEPPGCICSDIITGRAEPEECPMFLGQCTPERPYGPCMVSYEGTCYVRAVFGRRRA